MPQRGAPLPGIPGCSHLSCGRSAACPDEDKVCMCMYRHRLRGPTPRLPVRKPPPRGSCKGVFRPCPPTPLLVAGGDDKLSSSIRFLPFFVWLPYGDWLAQYRGSVHLLICRQKKAAKPIFLTVLRPFKPVFISWIPVGHTIPAVFSFSQLRTWR